MYATVCANTSAGANETWIRLPVLGKMRRKSRISGLRSEAIDLPKDGIRMDLHSARFCVPALLRSKAHNQCRGPHA
jgi:hypothetical protein